MNGDVCAVCVYNCTSHFTLPVGAIIVVIDAQCSRIIVDKSSDASSQSIEYRCIRIATPDQLIVNGRRTAVDMSALSTLHSNINTV